jgi:two-component system sensor histidine kinase KdpD
MRSCAPLRQLCIDVGADWIEIQADDRAQAIVDYAKSHQITQIVIGSSQRGRLQELMGGGSTVRKVSRSAAEAGIDVHIIARRDEGEPPEHVVGPGEPSQLEE